MASVNLPESRDGSTMSFHPWSRLPDELKLKILGHLLSEGEPVTHAKHEEKRHRRTGLFNVITTQNRALVSLAIEAYYKNKTFIVGRAYPPAHHGHLVQRMKIEATSTVYALLHSHSRWLYLDQSRLRSSVIEEEYHLAPTLSPATFPNLKHLELNFVVLSNSEDLLRPPWFAHQHPFAPTVESLFQCYHAQVAAIDWWGVFRSQARIKAKKVSVRVWCEGCRRHGAGVSDVSYSAAHGGDSRIAVQQLPPATCACEEKLHYMLNGVFTKKSGATDMRLSYRGERYESGGG